MKKELILIILILTISSVSAQLADSPWPKFRGNLKNTGLSPYDTSHVGGMVKWSFATGGGIESSPAIGPDGTIYVGSWDNKLYAINPDGTEKWHFTTKGLVRSSPAIGSDGTIYVGSAEKITKIGNYSEGSIVLYAINPDGAEKWHLPAGRILGLYSSPAIGPDGTIYYGSGEYVSGVEGGNRLYAINPDGTEKWHFLVENDMNSPPAIGSDGIVYIGSGDGNLYAINSDGTEKWHFTAGGFIESSPAVGSDGIIYFGSGIGNFYAVNSDGTLKWKFKTKFGEVFSSAAIGKDGTIYFGAEDKNFYAFNPDGAEKWHFSLPERVDSSPAIGADGTIYFGCSASDTDSHGFYALNPDGSVKWSALKDMSIVSSPAIGSDGTIYIGSWNGKLYAFGEKEQEVIEEEIIEEETEIEKLWDPKDEGVDCFNPGSKEIEEKCDIFCYNHPDWCPGYFEKKRIGEGPEECRKDGKFIGEDECREITEKSQKMVTISGFFKGIINWFVGLFE